LLLTAVGLNPAKDLEFFHVRKLYGTSLVLLMCQFILEIMHGKAAEVFLHY
jgi:hypothetical protein